MIDTETMDMPSCPICTTKITDHSERKKCPQCGNGDRTRSLFLFYNNLKHLTKGAKALVFTNENWLSPNCFAHCEKSIYLGENHLDIQKIDRDTGSYSWIASNHILEHVPNYSAALREMHRILADDGVLQITIPTPSCTYSTTDWGYADSDKMGHYRNYGADFALSLQSILPQAYVLAVFIEDNISPFRDVVYLIFKQEEMMRKVSGELFKVQYISVPLYSPSTT